MVWFKGTTINEIRDTWADEFCAVFIREEKRRIKEKEEIDRQKAEQGHQGSSGHVEHVQEDKVQNSQEMDKFFDED